MKCPTGYRLALIPALVLACSFCLPAPTFPQNRPATPPQKPEKAPPPPLFPKHRRGIYTNNQNIEVIDATPQSPPLETDDPSVPDKGEYEINLLTSADSSEDARRVDFVTVDANYGFVLGAGGHDLPTQLKIEFPVTGNREGANSYQTGLGTAAVGLKFNFYNDENRGLRVSVYPQLEFSTGSSAEKGVAAAGQTILVPLLISKELKFAMLVANGGVEKPIHDPSREITGEFGLGLGRAFFRKLALMGELRWESTFDFQRERLMSANIGAIYGVRKVISYARAGHSLHSDDGGHAFFAFGVKVLIDTAHPDGAKP